MKIYQSTIEKLNTLKGEFRKISDETGLDYDWLHQVARGKIADPGVKKIERLHSHLERVYGESAA